MKREEWMLIPILALMLLLVALYGERATDYILEVFFT